VNGILCRGWGIWKHEAQRHREWEEGRRKWGRPEEVGREEGGEIEIKEDAEREVIRRCRSRTFDARRCLI